MKIECFRVSPAINVLGLLAGKSLNAGLALSIVRAGRTLNQAAEDIEAQRIALLKKHSVLGEDGEPVIVQKDDGTGKSVGVCQLRDEAAFQREFVDLMGTEVDLGIKPISAALLGDLAISANEIAALEFLFAD
ncbi:hypothetical protein [Niveispirillum sp. KHB5.9]|uniref:hypothetical protein n=1 Tax=Niveispirillum sp. KHB5.9 TaxID=3400269 RepID=UPI003A83E480